MGSVGSGSFGDYQKKADDNLCDQSINSVWLEDVSRSSYYQKLNRLPDIMEAVQVLEQLHNGRIAVTSLEEDEIIGYLPARYSYLLGCMNGGKRYVGNIEFSTDKPIPKVSVNLDAE